LTRLLLDASRRHRIAAHRAGVCIAPAQSCIYSAQLLDAFAVSSHRCTPRWHLFRTGAVLLSFGKALIALLRDAFAVSSHRSTPRWHLFRTGAVLLSFRKTLILQLLDGFPASSHRSKPHRHV
jgi:hypothetical protein